MDRWCEQRMWADVGLETGGAELLSCGTALVLCVVPVLFPPRGWTKSLCALQAMLFLLGVGTFVYHWVPHDEDHINAFDWFPMILTCALLGYMLVQDLLKTHRCTFVFFVLLFGWALGLMVAMNQYDYTYLNAVLVVPPVLLLLALLPTSLPPSRHLQQEPFCRPSQEPQCQRVRTFLQESPRWWPFRQHPSSNPRPWLLPLRLSGHFRPH